MGRCFAGKGGLKWETLSFMPTIESVAIVPTVRTETLEFVRAVGLCTHRTWVPVLIE